MYYILLQLLGLNIKTQIPYRGFARRPATRRPTYSSSFGLLWTVPGSAHGLQWRNSHMPLPSPSFFTLEPPLAIEIGHAYSMHIVTVGLYIACNTNRKTQHKAHIRQGLGKAGSGWSADPYPWPPKIWNWGQNMALMKMNVLCYMIKLHFWPWSSLPPPLKNWSRAPDNRTV